MHATSPATKAMQARHRARGCGICRDGRLDVALSPRSPDFSAKIQTRARCAPYDRSATPIRGPMALALGHPVGHPGPAPGPRPPRHSREGGNPYGACSIKERLGFGAGYPDYAQWIPAFAGMTGWGAGPGWPTGWPRARQAGCGSWQCNKM